MWERLRLSQGNCRPLGIRLTMLSVDSLTRTHAPERVVGVSILYGGAPWVSVSVSSVSPRMNGPQQEPRRPRCPQNSNCARGHIESATGDSARITCCLGTSGVHLAALRRVRKLHCFSERPAQERRGRRRSKRERLERGSTFRSTVGIPTFVGIWMSARGSHLRRIQGYRRTQRELAQRPS